VTLASGGRRPNRVGRVCFGCFVGDGTHGVMVLVRRFTL
jgi:hypothetical protein